MIGTTVSRYKILSKLGGGGMGVVYEAEDLELGRHVALKFLPEDTADSPEALDRFKREVRAASALNHPYICTVYDVGRHEGKPFLIMERMSGRTLRHILDDGKLPIERVITLGEQIADGLGAAHHAGIVHRDLKPTNLFVTDRDEIKILDFGMAKLMPHEVEESPSKPSTAGSTPDPEHQTTPGMVVGTVAYMSPEQARGEPVDHRSDLFALGILLYRMASGRLPFISVSTGEFFRSLLADEPIPLRQLAPEIPIGFEMIVQRLLEKDPAKRYQSAAAVRADLRHLRHDPLSNSSLLSTAAELPAEPRRARPLLWAAAAIALAVLLAAGLAVAQRFGIAGPEWLPGARKAGGLAEEKEKRIAVLPFENLGGAGDAYFADGMSDEIQTKLAGLPGLSVIARGSTREYRDTIKRPNEIARELGVRYLLTATVRWQREEGKSQIRVSPALIEVVPGGGAPVTRWQGRFDAELADVFEVQSRIATQVANALELALGGEQERRIDERPTTVIAAYDAYLKGLEMLRRGNDTQTQLEASAEFERAVALDPRFALAWVQLAVARSIVYANGTRSTELRAATRSAASTALELAPELPDAHWAMAVYLRLVENDPAGAQGVAERGLALAPDDVNLLRNLGLAEREVGHAQESLGPMLKAQRLDPRNVMNAVALADTLARLHESFRARVAADGGLALAPGNYDLILAKVRAYLQEGDLGNAHKVLAELPPEVDRTGLVAYFATTDRLWSLEPELRDLLLRLEPGVFGGDRSVWASAMAGELWLRGRKSEARRYAEEARQAYETRIAENPDEALLHAQLGLMLAYLGRGAEAVAEGEHAVELAPLDKDGYGGTEALHLLALIDVTLGRKHEAVATLERLVVAPYWITADWLRVDPSFDALRGDPEFEKLESPSS
jgi:TolB-like protein